MVTKQEFKDNFDPDFGLKLYDDRQLMKELFERGIKPHVYQGFFANWYAQEQIETHKDEVRHEVYNKRG